MNNQIKAALDKLAQPDALLDVTDLHEFGFILPLCNIVGAHWYDTPIDYADVLALEIACYIAVIARPREWRKTYQITVGGMLALTE